jgi:hypothetical protein
MSDRVKPDGLKGTFTTTDRLADGIARQMEIAELKSLEERMEAEGYRGNGPGTQVYRP